MKLICTQCQSVAEAGDSLKLNSKCPACDEGQMHSITVRNVMAFNKDAEGDVKDNEVKPAINSLRHLMSNLVRSDTLEGKECWVIPTILITEGVHNGIFYPSDELAKYPESWNGEPVPIDHPDVDGMPVSCNSKEVLEMQTVGKVLNVKFEHPALKGEVWVDKEKAPSVNGGQDFIKKLENEQNIEVSTGLFIDEEHTVGVWNGEQYDRIARNHRPDHLAILPNSMGACSWNDGGGMPRLNKEDGKEDGTTQNDKRKKDHEEGAVHVTDNELSHDTLRMMVRMALKDKLSPNENSGEHIWIEDIFNDFVIYEHEKSDGAGLFKQAYAVNASDNVELVGDAVEVVKQISFVPVGSVNNENKENGMKDRTGKVNALIKNEKSKWKEDDRELLIGLSDEQFAKIEKPYVNEDEDAGDASDTGDAGDEGSSDDKGDDDKSGDDKGGEEETPTDNKAMTVNEFIENAPEGMQETLKRAYARDKQIHNKLVNELKANARCDFTEDELKAKTISELEKMATLCQVDVDYSAGAGTVVENDDDTIGSAPKMKWNKDGSADFSDID